MKVPTALDTYDHVAGRPHSDYRLASVRIGRAGGDPPSPDTPLPA
jgi:hypothetical protein